MEAGVASSAPAPGWLALAFPLLELVVEEDLVVTAGFEGLDWVCNWILFMASVTFSNVSSFLLNFLKVHFM